MPSGEPARARGYTYLGVLFLLALVGLSLAGAAGVASLSARRAQEAELLWVGGQYARALRAYAQATPGGLAYPQRLDELLEDRRGPALQRHLRRLYPDPLSGRVDWSLLRLRDGGIVGVASPSREAPLRRAHFPAAREGFEDARRYADWWFVAEREFAPARLP